MKERTELEKRIDEFRKKVMAIQKAFQQIKRTGINESVLITIIQRNAERFNTNRRTPISAKDVRAVISGVETLEKYLFEEGGSATESKS